MSRIHRHHSEAEGSYQQQQQQQQHQKSLHPPAMYDTSTSTTESNSYSSRSHNHAQGVAGAGAAGAGNHAFYPKSHPRSSSRERGAAGLRERGDPRERDLQGRSSPYMQGTAGTPQLQSRSSYEPAGAASWTASPVPNQGMAAAASQFTQRASYLNSPHPSGSGSGGADTVQGLNIGNMRNIDQQEVPNTHNFTSMSEPGGAEQAKFAAYINRFAEMDPRMDYRGRGGGTSPSVASMSTGNNSTTGNPHAPPPQRSEQQSERHGQQQGRPPSIEEEKKEERTISNLSVSQHVRKLNHQRDEDEGEGGGDNGNDNQNYQNFPDPEPGLEEMDDRPDDHPLPVFEQLTRSSRYSNASANPDRYGQQNRREASRERSENRYNATRGDGDDAGGADPDKNGQRTLRDASRERSDNRYNTTRGDSDDGGGGGGSRSMYSSRERDPSPAPNRSSMHQPEPSRLQPSYIPTATRGTRLAAIRRVESPTNTQTLPVDPPATPASTLRTAAFESVSPSNRTRDLARRFERRAGASAPKSQSPLIRGANLAHQLSERDAKRQVVAEPQRQVVAEPQRQVVAEPQRQVVAEPVRMQEYGLGHYRQQQQRERSASPAPRQYQRDRSASPPPPIQQRRSRSEWQEAPEGQRPSTSLPPVRRRRPLQQPAQSQQPASEQVTEDSTNNGHRHHNHHRHQQASADDFPDLNELAAQSRYDYKQRSEIETPLPAKVQDLRQKLWDPNEALQVPVRPSVREIKEREPLNQEQMHNYNHGPGNMRETSQRNSRSLSPKSSRRRLDNSGSQMFKSRYYQAAAAAQRSVASPERSLSTAGRKAASPYSHKPDVATDSARQIYTNLSEEEKEDNLRTIKNRYATSDVGPANGGQNVHSLMARLGAVDRANPDAALAQIDAILRAESRSANGDPVSSNRESSQNAQNTAGKDYSDQEAVEVNADDESSSEGDSDDATSVSSMTNPTYQSVKLAPDPSNGPHSTSAQGRPRPSALQSYAKSGTPYMNISKADEPNATSARDVESKSKSKKLRSPPPTTISLSSSKEKIKKSDDAPIVDPSVFQNIGGDSPAIATSNSAELAEKIRRWDDMSQSGPTTSSPARSTNPFEGDSPVRQVGSNPFEDAQQKQNSVQLDAEILFGGPGQILSAGTEALGSIVTDEMDRNVYPGDNPSQSRRPHPWDSSIPVGMGKVDMKDTSMDFADGVETCFTPRYGTDEKSPGGTPVRQMRKNRLGLGMGKLRKLVEHDEELAAPTTPSNLNESRSSDEFDVNPRGDEFDVNPMLMVSENNGDGDGWEVTAGRFSSHPRQGENTKNLSDDYDSAWVALPSSAFFAEKAHPSKRPPKRDMSGIPPQIGSPDDGFQMDDISGTPDRSFSLDKDDKEERAYNPNAPKRADQFQKFSPETQQSARVSRYTPPEAALHPRASAYDEGAIGDNTDDDEMGSIEVALVEPPVIEARNESRGRRGLRGLLKRRSKSSGKSSAAAKNTASSEVGAGSRIDNSEMLLQKAVDPVTGEIAPPRGRNRRGISKPPSRERAQSLEERRTPRNPTIAKKFTRLMRLYDDDVGYI
jgi:hypothetical protein